MQVIYPALFYEEKKGVYSVFIPDLDNASTSGNTLEEAMYMASDLIAGIVIDKIEHGEGIPTRSKIQNIEYDALEKHLDIDNWDYVSKFKTYIYVNVSLFAKNWGKKID